MDSYRVPTFEGHSNRLSRHLPSNGAPSSSSRMNSLSYRVRNSMNPANSLVDADDDLDLDTVRIFLPPTPQNNLRESFNLSKGSSYNDGEKKTRNYKKFLSNKFENYTAVEPIDLRASAIKPNPDTSARGFNKGSSDELYRQGSSDNSNVNHSSGSLWNQMVERSSSKDT